MATNQNLNKEGTDAASGPGKKTEVSESREKAPARTRTASAAGRTASSKAVKAPAKEKQAVTSVRRKTAAAGAVSSSEKKAGQPAAARAAKSPSSAAVSAAKASAPSAEKKEETGVAIKRASAAASASSEQKISAAGKQPVQEDVQHKDDFDEKKTEGRKKAKKRYAALLLLLLAVVAGGGFFLGRNISRPAGHPDAAGSQLSVKDALALARSYGESGKYEDALSVLLGIRAGTGDKSQSETDAEIRAVIKELFSKASREGREQEIFDVVRRLIDEGKYSDALKILEAIEISGDDENSVRLREAVSSLKKEAAKKAAESGETDKILELAQRLIEDGKYEDALILLNAVPADGQSAADRDAVERMKKKARILESAKNLSDEEKLSLAQKLMSEGRFDEAEAVLDTVIRNSDGSDDVRRRAEALKQAAGSEETDKLLELAQKRIDSGQYESALEILNSIPVEKTSAEQREKIDRMKRKAQTLESAKNLSDEEKLSLAQKLMSEGRFDEAEAVLDTVIRNSDGSDDIRRRAEALKQAAKNAQENGDSAVAFDENGNPVASEEQRRIQEEKLMQEKLAEEKKAEEKKAREQAAQKAEQQKKEAAEKKARAEAERKAQAERKAKEEAAAKQKKREEELAKAAAEKKAKEEAARIAAAEKKAQEAAALAAAQAQAEKKAREEAEAKAAAEQKAREEAIARQKKSVEESLSRGKQFLAEKNAPSALQEFSAVQKNMPREDRQFAGEKFSESAKVLFDASGNFENPQKKQILDKSAEMARSALQYAPDDPDSLFVMGMNALDRRDLRSAEQYLQKAAQKDPSNYRNYYQLGRVLAMQKKYDASLSAFKRAVSLNGNFAPAHYNSGFVYEQLGKKQEALASYKNACRIDPSHERAYMGAGHVSFENKNYDEAVRFYSSALKINPQRAQTYQELGSCYAELKEYSLAEQNFQKALSCPDATDEKNALTYYNLSSVLFSQGKKTDALSYAKMAYDVKEKTSVPVKTNIVYTCGLLNQDLGNEDEAKALYQEALRLDPDHVKSNINLGAVLLSRGECKEAAELLLKAYKAEPDNFEVNNNLGSAYRDAGDFENSVTFYKNALAIEPGNMTVKENLAKSYASAGKFADARSLYEELVSAQETNWELRLSLAKVCISLGDSQGAEKNLLVLQTRAPSFKTSEVALLLAELE
ncbi:MAG: tetratricopeptide repeat protein [Treponema sp.]|nr:tetratricopeptide repeat protein [Treponema sp.]